MGRTVNKSIKSGNSTNAPVKVPEGALNEFQNMGQIKKTTRTFVPKSVNNGRIQSIQLKILLENNK
jgi:hypothetical protein